MQTRQPTVQAYVRTYYNIFCVRAWVVELKPSKQSTTFASFNQLYHITACTIVDDAPISYTYVSMSGHPLCVPSPWSFTYVHIYYMASYCIFAGTYTVYIV